MSPAKRKIAVKKEELYDDSHEVPESRKTLAAPAPDCVQPSLPNRFGSPRDFVVGGKSSLLSGWDAASRLASFIFPIECLTFRAG
jgi:hypothetical protein